MGSRAERQPSGFEVVPSLLTVATVPFLADPSGALFQEDESTLLVADLHLEKGSSLARRGSMLPPYDTAATLAALAEVVARYEPRRIVALGDSFHDPYAASRLCAADLERLRALQAGREWLWLTGNHDPLPPENLAGVVRPEWQLGPVTLRHEPKPEHRGAEMAGHLHPVARVVGTSGISRRRCFLSDGHRCILPAFGAYAGGLNIQHSAYRALFGDRQLFAHALGRDRVYVVPAERCIADGALDMPAYLTLRAARS